MPEADLCKLTQRLKQIRIQRGLTQAAVAEKVGVNKSTITRWERGQGVSRINHAEMNTLGVIFNVSPNYLMGWIDEPLTPEAEAMENALTEVVNLYQGILKKPLPGQDPQSDMLNRKILSQVMMINQACLVTPEISAHIAEGEAHIAMKYLLTYYGIPWQEYGEVLLYKLLNSELMKNFMRNALSLLAQPGK